MSIISFGGNALHKSAGNDLLKVVVVVVLGFYVPPTAKVIWRRDLGLKSHPKDWRSPGSNSGPLVYKAGSLTARPRRLLLLKVSCLMT